MTSEVIPPVREGDATLRMLTAADLPLTLAWRNHPDSRAWFLSTAVLEPRQHELWFEAYQRREDDYVFIVEVDQTARAQVALYNISPAGAEFGRLLVDPDGPSPWQGDRPVTLRPPHRYFVVIGAVCAGQCATYDTETHELTPFNGL